MNWLYLVVNAGTLLIPFLFSFHPSLRFDKNWKAFFPAALISAIPFLIWDAIFTANGVWGFNQDFVTGIYLAELPLEEILFFICIPYACVFTYHCLDRLMRLDMRPEFTDSITWLMVATLAMTGFLNYDKAYTFITFISMSFLLTCCRLLFRVKWLGKFYKVYAILLLPFLIVNGILTGMLTEQPVVWYNDEENLGIRIITIPVEDIFYGMMLILLNLLFYHGILQRSGKLRYREAAI